MQLHPDACCKAFHVRVYLECMCGYMEYEVKGKRQEVEFILISVKVNMN